MKTINVDQYQSATNTERRRFDKRLNRLTKRICDFALGIGKLYVCNPCMVDDDIRNNDDNPGGALSHASDLAVRAALREGNPVWLMVSATLQGDYVGSAAEAANRAELARLYCGETRFNDVCGYSEDEPAEEALPGCWLISSDFGASYVVVRVDSGEIFQTNKSNVDDRTRERWVELRETLGHLSDYPLIDDETVWRVEQVWQDEAWESDICADFIEAMGKRVKNSFAPDRSGKRAKDRARLVGLRLKLALEAWAPARYASSRSAEDVEKQNLARGKFEAMAQSANEYWETENAGAFIRVERVLADVECADVVECVQALLAGD